MEMELELARVFFLCVVAGYAMFHSTASLAQNCELSDHTNQLKCEVMTYLGRPGKRFPEMRFIRLGDKETLEAEPYCYMETKYLKTLCVNHDSNNLSCGAVTKELYNCGASGDSFSFVKCSKWKRENRILCKEEMVAGLIKIDYSLDAAKFNDAMQGPTFQQPFQIEIQYRAQVGSFRMEIDAYKLAHDVWKKLQWHSIYVLEAHIARQIWYRTLITIPKSRDDVLKDCDAYIAAVGGDCQSMPSTFVVEKK